MNTLEWAIYYTETLKWSVIPIINDGKVPIKGCSPIPYRERIATRQELETWFKGTDYNIAVVTGKLSCVFVVDIDSEEGATNLAKFIPEFIVTPTVNTPKGQHLYFRYPNADITIGVGKIPGTDYRGEGGYIITAPSVIGGKKYDWVIGTDAHLAELPKGYIDEITKNVTECNTNNQTHNVNFSLTKGNRDETIFHIAHLLSKGGANRDEMEKVLEIVAKSCNPPFPQNEVKTKISSVIERAERKLRNISKEVNDWVLLQNGYFDVKSCYMELNIVTKEDKQTVRVCLSRLKDKTIEKHGTKDGVYKKIETEFDFIQFDEHEAAEKDFPIKLPLGLNDLAEISEGNIILVAGEFNSGKTSFLLNVLKDNIAYHPIRYITSEMSKSEFKKRFASFGLPLTFWINGGSDSNGCSVEYIKKSSDFHAVIRPDAINIIDYLEFRDSDYTKGAEYLADIHDKLTTGIAIVAIQKKEGQRMPRSGDLTMEKPRLAISFTKRDSSNEYPEGLCEIIKCKAPKLSRVDGRKLRFELQKHGSKFNVLSDWGYLKF